jgi:hypothetical protein
MDLVFYDDGFLESPNVTVGEREIFWHVGKRVLDAVIYSKRYEAAPLGFPITFHALTFTYTISGELPEVGGVTRQFEGKAKAWIDPDDGKWKLDSLTLGDEGEKEFTALMLARQDTLSSRSHREDPMNVSPSNAPELSGNSGEFISADPLNIAGSDPAQAFLAVQVQSSKDERFSFAAQSGDRYRIEFTKSTALSGLSIVMGVVRSPNAISWSCEALGDFPSDALPNDCSGAKN